MYLENALWQKLSNHVFGKCRVIFTTFPFYMKQSTNWKLHFILLHYMLVRKEITCIKIGCEKSWNIYYYHNIILFKICDLSIYVTWLNFKTHISWVLMKNRYLYSLDHNESQLVYNMILLYSNCSLFIAFSKCFYQPVKAYQPRNHLLSIYDHRIDRNIYR